MEIKEDKSIAFQGLDKKIQRSMDVILEAANRFERDAIALAWTGGKDSTTLLSLVRDLYKGKVPFKVFHIDTSVDFPEIYEFRDKLTKEWQLDLAILRHEDAKSVIESSKGPDECCYLLKTKSLDEGISKYGIKALLTAIRWDEQAARADELYFSQRENHMRINPILHFMEKDIWEYVRTKNIPYCKLYDEGYRSLGCVPCTVKSEIGGPERAGRAQDKEKIMEKLRELGYF